MKPEQWRALAAMKLRRLDREYEAVLNAQIKTDPNKFEGLAKVLRGSNDDDNAGKDDAVDEEVENQENISANV